MFILKEENNKWNKKKIKNYSFELIYLKENKYKYIKFEIYKI